MKTKKQAIDRIEDLLGQVSTRFTDEDPEEQEWMRERCSPAAQRVLADLNLTALHLLDAIPPDDSDSPSVNIIGLSRITGMPKGTVSKTVQRLVALGAVSRHQRADNRKEIHLRLTDLGVEIQRAHRSLHDQMGDTLGDFMSRYTRAELEVITRVLEDLLRLPREGLRFRPDLLDRPTTQDRS